MSILTKRTNGVTVAICCYGLFLEKARSSEEMIGLKQYLSACAKYIVASLYHTGRLSGIILCGGHTNPDFPDLSEASTNAKELISCLRGFRPPVSPSYLPILLEEQSRNTSQNIYNACDLIISQYRSGENILSKDVIFVCDRYRHLKVEAILRCLVRKRIWDFEAFSFRVKSFPRRDIHPNSCWSRQLGSAVLYYRQPKRFDDDLKASG